MSVFFEIDFIVISAISVKKILLSRWGGEGRGGKAIRQR